MSTSLYDLAGAYRQLLYMEINPDEDDVEAWNQLMAENQDDIDTKLSGYAHVILQLQADEQALKDEIDRLSQRKRSITNKAQRLKDYMRDVMIETGVDKVKDVSVTVRLQANPPALQQAPGAKVPEEYLIPQEPKVDRKGIAAALKAGEEIEGFTLVQGMGVRVS